jgi:hypothetical protein
VSFLSRQRWEKILNVQATKGKTELVFETQVERKKNCARDRGEERASFQDRGREKILKGIQA